MRIGYLHVGPARGGVRRYGRQIAAEADAHADHVAVHAEAGEPRPTARALWSSARRVRTCDVVHLQWKPNDWGRAYRALALLVWFTLLCRRPLVVTLHDVYEPGATVPTRGARAERWALSWLARRATRLVVHSAEERRRLEVLRVAARARVVPHFVERRGLREPPGAAKAALGLSGLRVVTLLGYITGRKGHVLLVEALPKLPEDVVAIMAGGPIEGRTARLDEIERRARELGVSDRVTVTGYLAEEALERVLAATDVATCPFRDVSASGSLSTWISVARPIVASDLPAFREYDDMEPGAIRSFSPREPGPLAHALTVALERATGGPDPAVARLRERLLTPRVFERYLEVYREAAAEGRSPQGR